MVDRALWGSYRWHMTTDNIKALRAKRVAIDDQITSAKAGRRKAEDDKTKAKFTAHIAALREERKRVGATLRGERARTATT